MEEHARFMPADERPPSPHPLQLAPLLGDWFNTNQHSRYLVEVRLRERSGTLYFSGLADGPAGPIAWDEQPARAYAAGTGLEAGGFTLCYQRRSIQTHLVANQKLGILVIQSYTSYGDGSGRTPHFSREFYHR